MRVFITGGNRGIGLQLATQLSEQGHEIIVACRKASPALAGLAVDIIEGFDVTKFSAFPGLLSQLKEKPIDLLIHNAGIMERTAVGDLKPEAIVRQFQVNSMGPLLLTDSLLPVMADGARVAIITSRMGSIADNTSGGSYGYRMSKAAVNAAGKSLAEDLKDRGISVNLLHPGWVKTDMTGNTGHLTPEESARLLIERMAEMTLEDTGRFVHASGERLPW